MNVVQDVLEKDAGWNWSTFWHMTLHGLEGSVKAHLRLSGDDATPDSHTVFPFADGNNQPPFASVVQNVKHCVELFHQRQKEELRCEFHLKSRHRVPGEEDLETVRIVFERVREILDGCIMYI